MKHLKSVRMSEIFVSIFSQSLTGFCEKIINKFYTRFCATVSVLSGKPYRFFEHCNFYRHSSMKKENVKLRVLRVTTKNTIPLPLNLQGKGVILRSPLLFLVCCSGCLFTKANNSDVICWAYWPQKSRRHKPLQLTAVHFECSLDCPSVGSCWRTWPLNAASEELLPMLRTRFIYYNISL